MHRRYIGHSTYYVECNFDFFMQFSFVHLAFILCLPGLSVPCQAEARPKQVLPRKLSKNCALATHRSPLRKVAPPTQVHVLRTVHTLEERKDWEASSRQRDELLLPEKGHTLTGDHLTAAQPPPPSLPARRKRTHGKVGEEEEEGPFHRRLFLDRRTTSQASTSEELGGMSLYM